MTKYITLKILIIIPFMAILSCINNKKNHKEKSIIFEANDSWKYKHLKGSFYTDIYGKLFEKKAYDVAGKGDCFNSQIYYDSIIGVFKDNKVIEKSLSEVLDIKTYKEFDIGSMYSIDKKNVYYNNVNSSGSDRFIVNEANPKTFKPLSDYLYGIDDKNIFYRGKKIQGLHFNKHKILYSLDTKDDYIDYIIDDKVVFYDGDTVKGADAKTFKLVAGKKWSAEDKNYKYECCGQRLK